MISILIPSCDYNVLPLVKRLATEAHQLGINFELLVQEDGQNNEHLTEAIAQIPHCTYNWNPQNLGRSKNRNHLLQQAQYDWVLLLDADVFPVYNTFLASYIAQIESATIVQGGLAYQKEKPEVAQRLRWTYGNQREVKSKEDRQKNPSCFTLCSNLFFNKKQHPFRFDESIQDYGYEDVLFFQKLFANEATICALDNPVYHLNLDTNTIFIQKTTKAMHTLAALVAEGKIQPNQTTLTKVAAKINKSIWVKPILHIFKKSLPLLEFQLKSPRPSLVLFDLYKLGIYLQLTNEKKQKKTPIVA